MTVTWTHDRTPTGYLESTSRMPDRDCLRREHLEDVMRARRDRDSLRSDCSVPTNTKTTSRFFAWWNERTTNECLAIMFGIYVAVSFVALVVMNRGVSR